MEAQDVGTDRSAAGPPLARHATVRAVLDLGVDRFSMHSVARHLGVSATALYREYLGRLQIEHGAGRLRAFQLSAEEQSAFSNLACTIDFDFDATFEAYVAAIVSGLEPS